MWVVFLGVFFLPFCMYCVSLSKWRFFVCLGFGFAFLLSK